VVSIPVCTVQFQGRAVIILILVIVLCPSMHELKCLLKHVTDTSIGLYSELQSQWLSEFQDGCFVNRWSFWGFTLCSKFLFPRPPPQPFYITYIFLFTVNAPSTILYPVIMMMEAVLCSENSWQIRLVKPLKKDHCRFITVLTFGSMKLKLLIKRYEWAAQ